MKKLAFSLILASLSMKVLANEQMVVGGIGAKEFYEILNVEETKIPPAADQGINPLRASKNFEARKINILCEERLFSTSCKFETGARGEDKKVSSITVQGEAADILCEALNVHDEARDQVPGGINPLTCKKYYKTSDEALHINCDVRFFGAKTCHIYYYEPKG